MALALPARRLLWQHFEGGAFWALHNLPVFLSLLNISFAQDLTEQFQGTISFLLHQIFLTETQNLQVIKKYYYILLR